MNFLKNWLGSDVDSLGLKRSGSWNKLDRLFIFALIVIGAAIYTTSLGFHMMDPWENHYSQVTWETLDHSAFARLWYQGANRFWSKPPLLFWIQMPFFLLFKLFNSDPNYVINEFMARLPVVLFSLGVLVGFYTLLSRLLTRSAAIISTFVLMMAPMYYQLTRQIMVDLPFIGLNACALLAMTIYFFGDIKDDDKIKIGLGKLSFMLKRRDYYLYLFYFLEGWAFLAKGLLSILMPACVLFIYMLITGNFGIVFRWRHFKKHLIGLGVYLLVAGPWVAYMWFDAGKEFFDEFIIYHHFKRAAGEIHKPNDLFTLYVRILGYALFPWSMFIPMAFYRFFQGARRLFAYRLQIFLFSIFLGPFFFYAYSSTKFHHYIAPVVPPLAIIIGYYLDGLWRERWTIARKVEALIAILILAIVARDIGNKYAVLVHMVTFFQERTLPMAKSFLPTLIVVCVGIGLVLFMAIVSPKSKNMAMTAVFAFTAAFMLQFFLEMMPRAATLYSLKPLYTAYIKDSPERAPIADYYKWLRKSNSLWFQNNITFLMADKEDSVLRFYDRPGVQYAIVKNPDKKRFESLMARIKKTPQVIATVPLNSLYRVAGGRTKDLSNAAKYKVSEVPADAVKVGAIFDNVIEIVGYKISEGSARPKENETVKIDVYFKALADNIKMDYTVFVHNEGDKGDKRTKGDESMAYGDYPTTFWKKGDIVKHPIFVRIPGDNKNTYYTVYTGIYQEEYRANIINVNEVENDRNNRLALVKLYIQK